MKRRGKVAPAVAPPGAKSPRKRRRGGRGALWLIAFALALSGALRLGGETGQAIASELTDGAHRDPTDVTGDGSCEPPADIAEVLRLLKTREERIVVNEAALADRMQALAVAETQVAKNLSALEAAEASLEATIALASTAAEDDLARLTSVYENMKAKEAAEVFAAMDPQFAAGFLGRMRADAAAAIMSGLDPEAAYAISVLLAGRNAEVPTE